MQKNSFVLQTRLNSLVAKLSDKQAGTLFKGILNYAENGVKATFEDGMVDIVFEMVKQDIDYTAQKYAEICKRNADNGKLGGRPKQVLLEKPNGYLKNPKKPNGYFGKHNDNDNDVDNDIKEKEKDKEKEKTTLSIKRFKKPSIDEIKAYCLERKNKVDPQRFFDFYESKGWKVGNSPMKDWKAAVRTWEHSSTASEQKQSERDRWRMPSPEGKYAV